jgi:hypothetical protein
MKLISIICAALLVIACFQLPIQYYTFLRIVVTTGAILVLLSQMKKDVNFLGITFIMIILLFNPILPIYLYSKNIWMPIDITTAGLFLISGFKNKEN